MNLKIVLLLILCLAVFCSFQLFSRPPPAVQASNKSGDAFMKWGQKIAPRFGLVFIGEGSQFIFYLDKDPSYNARKDFGTFATVTNFAAWKKMTLEEGREFIKPLIREFWTEVNRNPIHQYAQKLRSNATIPSKITPNMLGIKLTFWDENTDRPEKPYLAQMRLYNGKLQYFYTDPKTKRLAKPPVEESIQDFLNTLDKF